MAYKGEQVVKSTGSYIYRMLTPDSIVPNPANPQSFNRYTYVLNSPVNFTDPTGHCEFGTNEGTGETIITRFDCSVEEFQELGIEQRILWVEILIQMNQLGGWFDDILGVMNYFSESDVLGGFGEGSWISWGNAGVLHALQNGTAIFRGEHLPQSESGGAASSWAQWFGAWRNGAGDTELTNLHWIAEQAGADWGYAIATQKVGDTWSQGWLQGQLLDNFFSEGSFFRKEIGSKPLGGAIPFFQPTFHWFGGEGTTYYLAHLIENLTIRVRSQITFVQETNPKA